ncbi:MAG: hypothetical protein HRU24_17260 [Gammaproteobacteria bacterium]|nr:hypothetical protein [Gammaproteobacteria bacterium]
MKPQKKYLLDDPKNIKRMLRLFYGCCILLFILDFIVHRHISHDWEILWGFYPLFGFVACVLLVLAATWMRTFLMRDEDYYSNEGTDDKAITSSDTNSDDASSSKENFKKQRATKTGDDNVDS